MSNPVVPVEESEPVIPATDPSPGFPGGAPALYLKDGLACGGSSSPRLFLVRGDTQENWPVRYPSFARVPKTYLKANLALGGSSLFLVMGDTQENWPVRYPPFPDTPDIYLKGELTIGGSSNPVILMKVGDPNERWKLYDPFPEVSWYDVDARLGFVAGGSNLTTESSE